MAKRPQEKQLGNSWLALFRTIPALRLPWLWIAVGLILNLSVSHLYLQLPDTTTELLNGDLSGQAIMKAVSYYATTAVVSLLAIVTMVHAQAYSSRRAREGVWKKMLGLRMEYFDRNDPSELMSTITNDAGAAHDLVNLLLNLIPAVYYVVGALTKINQYHIILMLSCFALLPIKFIYALILGRIFQKSSIRLYDRIGNLTGFLADRIAHLTLIKTYTNEEKEQKNGVSASEELMKANMRIVHQENVSIAITSTMDVIQKFVVIVVAVILLQQKMITFSMWLTFFLFSQTLFSYMDQIVDSWTRVKSLQGSFHRIIEIMQSENEPSGALPTLPDGGDIRFEHVTFSYPEADAPALKDVSFTVPHGSAAAIVGLCGSGKTTAISLLERLYQPDEGRVLIGETDIKDISLSEYRKKFSYVQQGAGVFGGSLRELLTYGIDRTLTDEEIIQAAERTGFSEYLSLCPLGLDTDMSAEGGSMSGGQEQRLVLTREVLRGGDIILMDEPTSALDVEISAKIQSTMDEVFANKTRILVTHDLQYAKRYGKILVMYNGNLVGEGTHEQLLENCEVYRSMHETEGATV